MIDYLLAAAIVWLIGAQWWLAGIEAQLYRPGARR